MKDEKEIFGIIEDFFKGIPFNMKITICASFIIGLLGHMFCYTNILFLHDAAGVYWNSISFADAASGSRWLYPVYDWILNGVQMPWLDGTFTLLLYGISAWVVCEILNIRRKVLIIFVAGLMVLSPTAIASNCYLSSAPIYASALLFSCLAIYAFYEWKHGIIWCLAFLLICEGSYAAYVGFSICLFFLRMYTILLEAKEDEELKLLKEHFVVLFCVLGSLIASFGIMKLLQTGTMASLQGRILEVPNAGINTYFDNVYTTLRAVGFYFLPFGSASYMQERPIVYTIFIISIITTSLMYLKLLVDNKFWKRKICVLLLMADVILLPFAMNFLGLITWTHTLMQFAFITPWIFCLHIYEYVLENDVVFPNKKRWLKQGYSWIVILLFVSSLYNWYVMANTVYMKEAVLYEAGISLTNRIVDRIESTEEYKPGETSVVFIGNTREHYAPYHEGFEICDSIAGIGSGWWDTSLTFNYPLIKYIQQHLGINMEILNESHETGISMNHLAQVLAEKDISIDEKVLEEQIGNMESYPSSGCVKYIGDVLVFKLSD